MHTHMCVCVNPISIKVSSSRLSKVHRYIRLMGSLKLMKRLLSIVLV